MTGWTLFWIAMGGLILLLALYDILQKEHPVLRIFPVIGHLRYLLIEFGPELRQYIVAQNREEQPFNRSEREWIYRSANHENNYFGFGTDDQVYGIGYPIIKHAVFSSNDKPFTGSQKDAETAIHCAKTMGAAHRRALAWRPPSIINISAMSFGSLGKNAISALNKGAALAGCYHNTGEGGCSRYHRLGADICLQIGTGYFGARDPAGFNLDILTKLVADVPRIRMIEIKLSQGAKPGKGGVLPGVKVTAEIAEARGVQIGHDCISPNSHPQFRNVDEMIDFIERIAAATGRPVGIKSAIGHLDFWYELAEKMARNPLIGPDFITIDGTEGGTGAAPLAFADHVALPYRVAFPRVYRIFAEAGLADDIVWIGAGKLGFGDRTIVAMALGADMVNVAREAMLAMGCIQAQKCHTSYCPTGITTQRWWLQRGLDIDLAANRVHGYIETFRKELEALTHAAGYEHPGQFTPHDVEVSAGPGIFKSLYEIYGYDKKQYAPGHTPEYKAQSRAYASESPPLLDRPPLIAGDSGRN